MFSKKKKIEKESEETGSFNQDLIVHNMPKIQKLGESYSSGVSTVGFIGENKDGHQNYVGDQTKPVSNFKTIGLVIMFSGLVVIGGLFYVSYRFIVAPAANTNKDLNVTVISENQSAATTTPLNEPAIMASTTDLSTTTLAVLDQATSTVVGISEEVATSTSASLPDTDGDGLNDGEELLLGSSPTLADTDSDGYSDFAEVISGYNPAGSGKINNNDNLTDYTNQAFNYSVLYPKNWPLQSLNKDATVVFTTPDNSLIQISVQDNPDSAGIISWYEENFPDVTVNYDQVRNTYSWEGIMGENGLNFYLTDKKKTNIFVVSYISATADRLAYPDIFQLLINSLLIK